MCIYEKYKGNILGQVVQSIISLIKLLLVIEDLFQFLVYAKSSMPYLLLKKMFQQKRGRVFAYNMFENLMSCYLTAL